MTNRPPKHIAIIMDGNRRWASTRGLPEFMGHDRGIDTLVKIIEESNSLGIEYVTVYALSTENFKARSEVEIKTLLQLLKVGLKKYLPRLKEGGVRLNVIGKLKDLPIETQDLINKAQEDLADGTKGVLTVALNYGGRAEIIQAADKISKKGEDFSEENFERELFTSKLPEPDLLIRTGGQRRLSNFLLWQLSYADMYFTDTLWPDFDKAELKKAIDYFKKSKKNFGK